MTIDLNDYPLWSIFLVSFISILAASEIGRRLGVAVEAIAVATTYPPLRGDHGRAWPTGCLERLVFDRALGAIRRHQLLTHPLCAFCLERGFVDPATICDHVEPHHGDVNKFWLGRFKFVQAVSRRRRSG